MEDVTTIAATRKPDISKSCEQCGQAFDPRSGSGGKPQRFCSIDCRICFHRNAQRGQRSPTCNASAQLPAVLSAETPENAPGDTAEDFDWSADGSSIILREQPATAVYFNREGSLVIRQHRWPDEDSFVYIAESSIADFLDKLTDICGVPSVGKP